MDFATPLVALVLGLVMVGMLSLNKRWLLAPLLLAYVLRLLTILFHNYLYSLPQGGADALVFHRVAFGWAQNGCIAAFGHLDPTGSYLYSGLLALVYGCAGESQLAAQILNAVAGTLSVAILSIAAARVWGRRQGVLCAWALAVFPALLVYSAVTLRESFILALFSCSVYAIVRLAEHGRLRWAAVAIAFMAMASTFHGGMAFGIFGLIGAMMFQFLYRPSSSHKSRMQRNIILVGVLAALSAIALLVVDRIFIPKIGYLGNLDTELVSGMVESRAQGGAAYLVGLSVSSPLDIVWQAPIRMAYLLFSPFLWNIGSPSHLLGLLDGLIYLSLTIVTIRNRKHIFSNPACVLLLGVLLALAFVYAFGTSNFGTAMRHRAKFYVAILVVAIPFLSKARRRLSS